MVNKPNVRIHYTVAFVHEHAGEAFYNGCSPEFAYRWLEAEVYILPSNDKVSMEKVEFRSGNYAQDLAAMEYFVDHAKHCANNMMILASPEAQQWSRYMEGWFNRGN